MKIFAFALLVGSAVAQITCPSNEILKLPDDATAASPRNCINTAIPATKSTVLVSDGPSLALAAKCGTTVNLKPGNYGSVTFPSCTAGNWLIIKAATDQSTAGSRFANSKPPHFDKITTGSYTRLGPGLEVKSASLFSSFLINVRSASHIVVLRNHISGIPTNEIGHAIIANGSDHIAVVGNVIEEIHCKAGSNGKCSDAQGLLAGCGHSGAGFLIENNYIEASTENVLFGGCGADQTATDVIIERNHFFKPLTWMLGSPGYVGIAFTVKNSLEFKNVQRALVQYNLFENSWGGFSQDGYCILLTPKNQSGGAPNAQVSDVIVRYNKCIAGSGLQFAAAKDTPVSSNFSSLGTVNASVHDNLFIVDPKFAASRGLDLQLTLQDGAPQTKFTGINISNNSFTGATNAAIMFGGSGHAGTLVFQNNILWNGQYGSVVTSNNSGDCGAGLNTKPILALTNCWSVSVFSQNYIVGGKSVWPAGNSTPTLSPFVSISAGDFHSTVVGLGADIDKINANLVP